MCVDWVSNCVSETFSTNVPKFVNAFQNDIELHPMFFQELLNIGADRKAGNTICARAGAKIS